MAKFVALVSHPDIIDKKGKPRGLYEGTTYRGFPVTVELKKSFTLAELKKNHNVHLEAKVGDAIRDVGTKEYAHTFNDDMLAFFKAMNAPLGWQGTFRLPTKLEFISPAEYQQIVKENQPTFQRESKQVSSGLEAALAAV